MKDEEALKSHRHEWVCTNYLPRPPTVNEADAYAAGFRAGLKHARAWRPLTEDPATWPEEGQRVLMLDAEEDETRVVVWPRTTSARGWSHWAPLPEKSP